MDVLSLSAMNGTYAMDSLNEQKFEKDNELQEQIHSPQSNRKNKYPLAK